jgi:putative nucleotidyltransferase with HDIG domain
MALTTELMHLGVGDDVDRRTEIEKLQWALLAHHKAARTLRIADHKDQLLEGVCQSIVTQKPYELAWVGFREEDASKTISLQAKAGSKVGYTDHLEVGWAEDSPLGLGPAGVSVRTGKPVIIKDSAKEAVLAPVLERAVSFGLQSIMAVPIFKEPTFVMGVLLVYATVPNAFGNIEVHLFESLADDISIGLRNIEQQQLLDNEINVREAAQQQLGDALRATVEAMSRTMESRDPYTAGHQARVAKISVALAENLGWSQNDKEGLYLAAMVHDIGKVGIPSDILTKPSVLTPLEMQLVQQHAELGYQILKDIPFPWPIAEMVRQHHERLDGSGYPMKLKEHEILIGAKVLAVADTLEAMGSHRPYRPALGLSVALEQIQRESGVSLDSKVVSAAFTLAKGDNALQAILDERHV